MANIVIYNKYGRAQPNVAIAGTAQWSAVRMVQNGDPTDGGVNGAVNIALKALTDRTEYLKQSQSSNEALQLIVDELNRLRQFVYANTADGVQRIRLQLSRDAPSDTDIAWIEADVDTTIDADCSLTLEGGQVMSLLDTGCRITVDSNVYEFASAESMGLIDITLPSSQNESDDSLPSFDSLPVDDSTEPEISIPSSDTMTAEPVTVECNCDCSQDSITVDLINQSIDNLFNNL